ncbi:hypothetical protein [Desulfovibrio litoralis]|uniref:Uncharacterized protein n=1 Tax=Desulfovibrio litoralis DSM 11393 TaxID=1121455 RepID=A0A1M7SAY9_9BACT|nr:hypothetical protein [Desulfovibrio litoralis]SHN55680.1 hypothetical protein SAMN02745728_00705 [Desulfovibrio litoralis DSM 11393]
MNTEKNYSLEAGDGVDRSENILGVMFAFILAISTVLTPLKQHPNLLLLVLVSILFLSFVWVIRCDSKKRVIGVSLTSDSLIVHYNNKQEKSYPLLLHSFTPYLFYGYRSRLAYALIIEPAKDDENIKGGRHILNSLWCEQWLVDLGQKEQGSDETLCFDLALGDKLGEFLNQLYHNKKILKITSSK